MAYFTHVLPGTKSNNDRDQQRGNNHYDSQWPPYHTPTDIFKKPENNVEVFHFTKTEWDRIVYSLRHYIINFKKYIIAIIKYFNQKERYEFSNLKK